MPYQTIAPYILYADRCPSSAVLRGRSTFQSVCMEYNTHTHGTDGLGSRYPHLLFSSPYLNSNPPLYILPIRAYAHITDDGMPILSEHSFMELYRPISAPPFITIILLFLITFPNRYVCLTTFPFLYLTQLLPLLA